MIHVICTITSINIIFSSNVCTQVHRICSVCVKTQLLRGSLSTFIIRVVQCQCYITYRMSSDCERTCSDTCVTSQPGLRLRRKDTTAAAVGDRSKVTSETSPTIPAMTVASLVVRLQESLWNSVTKLAPDMGHIYFLDSKRGMLLAILTWVVLIASETLMFLFVFLPIRDVVYDVGNVAVSLLLAALVGASHLKTIFTDPVSETLINH